MSWDLRHGNGLTGLSEAADNSCDLVIADPPYDEKTHEGALNAEEIDFPPFTEAELRLFVREALRTAKRWVIAFCAMEQFGLYKDAAGDCWIRAGLWEKITPQKTGDRPGVPGEGIAIMHAEHTRKRWNNGGMPAIWKFPSEKKKLHPTEKPIALMRAIVKDFSDPGELIVDPFSGRATTGAAAVIDGRNFLGYELSEKHYKSGLRRLRGTREQLALPVQFSKPMKQIKLIGGSNGKAEESVQAEDGQGQAAAGGDVLAGVRRDLRQGAEQGDRQDPSDGQENGPVDFGAGVGEVRVPDRDREEGDPLDGQPEGEESGPEEFGEPDENAGW